jgi:hypothetical protein
VRRVLTLDEMDKRESGRAGVVEVDHELARAQRGAEE